MSRRSSEKKVDVSKRGSQSYSERRGHDLMLRKTLTRNVPPSLPGSSNSTMNVTAIGAGKALADFRKFEETPRALINRWMANLQNEETQLVVSPGQVFSQEQERQSQKEQSQKTAEQSATAEASETTVPNKTTLNGAKYESPNVDSLLESNDGAKYESPNVDSLLESNDQDSLQMEASNQRRTNLRRRDRKSIFPSTSLSIHPSTSVDASNSIAEETLEQMEQFEDSTSLGATSLEEKIQLKGKGASKLKRKTGRFKAPGCLAATSISHSDSLEISTDLTDVISKRPVLKRRVKTTLLIETPASNMTSTLTSDGDDLEVLVQEKKKTNLKRRATQIPANIPDIEFTQSSIEISSLENSASKLQNLENMSLQNVSTENDQLMVSPNLGTSKSGARASLGRRSLRKSGQNKSSQQDLSASQVSQAEDDLDKTPTNFLLEGSSLEQLTNSKSKTLLRRSLKKTPNRSITQNDHSVESAEQNQPDLENTLVSLNDSNFDDLISRKSNNLSRRSLRKTPNKTLQNETAFGNNVENVSMSKENALGPLSNLKENSSNTNEENVTLSKENASEDLMTSTKLNMSQKSQHQSPTEASPQENASTSDSDNMKVRATNKKSSLLQKSLHQSPTVTSPQENTSTNDSDNMKVIATNRKSNVLQKSLRKSPINGFSSQENVTDNETNDLEVLVPSRKSNISQTSLQNSLTGAISSEQNPGSNESYSLEVLAASRKSVLAQRSLRKSSVNASSSQDNESVNEVCILEALVINRKSNISLSSFQKSQTEVVSPEQNVNSNGVSNLEDLLTSKNYNMTRRSLQKTLSESVTPQEQSGTIEAKDLEVSATSRKSKLSQRNLHKSSMHDSITRENSSAHVTNHSNLLVASRKSLTDASTSHPLSGGDEVTDLMANKKSNSNRSLHKSQTDSVLQIVSPESSNQDVENRTADASTRSSRRFSNQTLTEIQTNSSFVEKSLVSRTKAKSFAVEIEKSKHSLSGHHVSFSATEQRTLVSKTNVSLLNQVEKFSNHKSRSSTNTNEVSIPDKYVDPVEAEPTEEVPLQPPVVDETTKDSLKKFRKRTSRNESRSGGSFNDSFQFADEDQALSTTKKKSIENDNSLRSQKSLEQNNMNSRKSDSLHHTATENIDVIHQSTINKTFHERRSPRKTASLHQTSFKQADVQNIEVPNQSSSSNNKMLRHNRSFKSFTAADASTNKTTGSKGVEKSFETVFGHDNPFLEKIAGSFVLKSSAIRELLNCPASMYPPIDNSLPPIEMSDMDSALETTDLEQQVNANKGILRRRKLGMVANHPDVVMAKLPRNESNPGHGQDTYGQSQSMVDKTFEVNQFTGNLSASQRKEAKSSLTSQRRSTRNITLEVGEPLSNQDQSQMSQKKLAPNKDFEIEDSPASGSSSQRKEAATSSASKVTCEPMSNQDHSHKKATTNKTFGCETSTENGSSLKRKETATSSASKRLSAEKVTFEDSEPVSNQDHSQISSKKSAPNKTFDIEDGSSFKRKKGATSLASNCRSAEVSEPDNSLPQSAPSKSFENENISTSTSRPTAAPSSSQRSNETFEANSPRHTAEQALLSRKKLAPIEAEMVENSSASKQKKTLVSRSVRDETSEQNKTPSGQPKETLSNSPRNSRSDQTFEVNAVRTSRSRDPSLRNSAETSRTGSRGVNRSSLQQGRSSKSVPASIDDDYEEEDLVLELSVSKQSALFANAVDPEGPTVVNQHLTEPQQDESNHVQHQIQRTKRTLIADNEISLVSAGGFNYPYDPPENDVSRRTDPVAGTSKKPEKSVRIDKRVLIANASQSGSFSMPSPIETVTRMRHQFFTPRVSRQPLRLQENDDVDLQPSTSNAHANEPQLEPEVQAILDDDFEDISDNENDTDMRQKVVNKTSVVKKSPRRKKSTDESDFSFVTKASAIFDIQMFSGMKLAKEAQPVLMEAIAKFNHLSLRRLKTILVQSGRTKAGLLDVKQLLIENGDLPREERCKNWSLYSLTHKVVNEWEVRYKLLPGAGDPNLPKDLWDAVPSESESDVTNIGNSESDIAEESYLNESRSRRRSSGIKRRYPYTGQRRRKKKAKVATALNSSETG